MVKNIYSFISIIVFLCLFATGCATTPEKKTVGQTVGGSIDTAITWTSQGIQKLLNKKK